MKRFILSLAVAIGALGSLALFVPALATAQTSSTGLLTVYVTVNTQNGTSYYAPSNFTVSVAGNGPSLTNFAGSQNGTAVTLYPGSYNVSVSGANGYTPSYSVGCNNTIAAGQSQTCIVTMSYASDYYTPTYPYNYPYPYGYPPLTCQANASTVGLGQNVSFTAVGGQGGTYNWEVPDRNYPNVGPVLTVSFSSSGTQLVTVTNAAQTATCTINVTNSYVPTVTTSTYPTYPTYSNYPTTYYPAYTAPTTYPSYTSYYYPALPRTGFAPHDLGLALAVAAALFIAAGLIITPYARKIIAFAVR